MAPACASQAGLPGRDPLQIRPVGSTQWLPLFVGDRRATPSLTSYEVSRQSPVAST